MNRLFGAYVMVDFSAAEGKKTGESSVWIGVMKRDVRFRLSYEAHNPATRAAAMTQLRSILVDLHKRGDRVLIGVNFALGFPRGLNAKLGLGDWSAMWDFLGKSVVDKPDNTNNRFQVAAKINRLTTDEAWPFWGGPKSAAQKWLSTLKPETFGGFPEYRLTEDAARDRVKKTLAPKSLWQMHGAGVVGGQAMLGIVAIKALVNAMAGKAKVWPLQTGFGALEADDFDEVNTVIAEVFPPLFDGPAEAGEVKDAAAVRLSATAFAEMDDRGELGALFSAPTGVSEADLAIAASEEGWMLGV